HATGQVQGQFAEVHGTRLIRGPHPTHIGGHVGNHKVHRLLADRLQQSLEHLVLGEIPLNEGHVGDRVHLQDVGGEDRKSTRLNSSHVKISYAVFCLKK